MINFDFLDQRATQSGFARLVGVSQPSIHYHVGRALHMGETYRTWLLAYCEHLRYEAAGRSDLNQARQIQKRVRGQVRRRSDSFKMDYQISVS